MTAALIPLTQLAPELAKLTADTAPTYRRLYLKALDGALPGAHLVNSRWHVCRSDLRAIAKALGLKPASRANSHSTGTGIETQAA